jgi:hypothetical protein
VTVFILSILIFFFFVTDPAEKGYEMEEADDDGLFRAGSVIVDPSNVNRLYEVSI